jgi:ATP-dependent Clp protease ATP-binding subunit ClpA
MIIVTHQLDEYRKYIEKDPALERRFQQVRGRGTGMHERMRDCC